MTKSIEEIASVHLGKAGDGTVVKPYVTPNTVDKSLLVAIPRSLNRTQYKISEDNLPFVGFDSWNAYEISFLTNNGYPVNCIAKIVYPANSKCIVESKSLKLYLNSYNMERLGSTSTNAIFVARNRIEDDLRKALDTEVIVYLHDVRDRDSYYDTIIPVEGTFELLEDNIPDIESIEFHGLNEDSTVLRVAPYTNHKDMHVWTPALRSNCRVTNQPDWGDVYIYMRRNEALPSYASLLKYIVSMRRENHFHEEICECIYKRLMDAFNPVEIFVACLYTRRGGIDINPVRASHDYLLEKANGLRTVTKVTQKTMRQ